MSKSAPQLVALASAMSGVKCGPTSAEAGQAVLMVAPAVLLVGMGVASSFAHLWTRRYPDIRFSWRPGLGALAVLCVGAVLSLVLSGRASQWAGHALWLFGTSYLTLLLLVLRIWFASARDRALTWSPVAAMVPMVALAVPLACGAGGTLGDVGFAIWVYGGYGGIVTAAVLLPLLAEVLIRGRRGPSGAPRASPGD